MTTTYHPLKFALTDGQKRKLQKAYASGTAVDLRIKPEQIVRGDDILLTATQINRVQKAVKSCKGVDLKLSQTQIENTAQRGGNLFSAMLRLARSLIKPALGALASEGLSFGAEKVLKKIFGNGIGPQEVELYKLVQETSPAQKKALEKQLVGEGLIRGVVWLNMVAFLVRWRLLEYHLLSAC